MASADLSRLATEKNLLVITSTYGDGEPPDSAKALHTAVRAAETPTLSNLRFSVCALGDTNYALFCQCGKDFDAAFEKLGATRTVPRVDCDLDYDESFTRWLDAALNAFGAASAAPSEHPKSPTADSRRGEKPPTPAKTLSSPP